MRPRRLFTDVKTGRSAMVTGAGKTVPESVLKEIVAAILRGQPLPRLTILRYGLTEEDIVFFMENADENPRKG